MPFSWMLYRVPLVRTEVLEESIASIFRVTRIGELGTTLAVTSNPKLLCASVTLMMEAKHFFETSVLIRVTRLAIPIDGILHSHRRENLKSYLPDCITAALMCVDL
jgi:hypothetical protein